MDKEGEPYGDSNNQQNKVWNYYQNRFPESFEGARPRLDYIIKEISKKTNKPTPRVLNIGAGSGYFEETSKRLGWDICSLDPDADTVKKLNKKGVKGYIGYIEMMPFDDESFDFVVASEVLEHLNDEKFHRGIREVFRVIVQDGWFLGTVPYCENLRLNQVVCPKCGEVFHRWGHIQSFDSELIKSLLSPYFLVEKIVERPFPNWFTMNWKGKVQAFASMLLYYFGIHGSNENVFFIATKSSE